VLTVVVLGEAFWEERRERRAELAGQFKSGVWGRSPTPPKNFESSDDARGVLGSQSSVPAFTILAWWYCLSLLIACLYLCLWSLMPTCPTDKSSDSYDSSDSEADRKRSKRHKKGKSSKKSKKSKRSRRHADDDEDEWEVAATDSKGGLASLFGRLDLIARCDRLCQASPSCQAERAW
jgi:hypothetical protein